MAFPKIDGYVVTEKIGSGSYSTVYKAYNKVGGRSTVAVKCVAKCRVKHSGAAVDNLVTEIRLMKSLVHPHIVRMHNFTWDDTNIYIIMEYCSGGDLSKYIRRYGRVRETQVRYFLQQLASALKFLHEKGIAHMDLKPHNLLLHKESTGTYILKVADFGFAQHMSSAAGGVRGSPLYMAPEMVAGAPARTADLWSVGVIMYECLFGKAPYSSATFKELVDKIQRQVPIQIPPNSSISEECKALLLSLLQHSPQDRIGYEEFFNNEYLDLEHMPSPENYEKAVSLAAAGAAAERAGGRARALQHYTAALRYLVPHHAAHPHPSLHTQLHRYMERAEELKLYLKGAATHAPTDAPTPTPTPTSAPTPTHAPPTPTTTADVGGHSQDGRVSDRDDVSSSAAAHTQPHNELRPRGLRRLLSRPFADDRDAAAPSGAQPKSHKETESDACRIT